MGKQSSCYALASLCSGEAEGWHPQVSINCSTVEVRTIQTTHTLIKRA